MKTTLEINYEKCQKGIMTLWDDYHLVLQEHEKYENGEPSLMSHTLYKHYENFHFEIYGWIHDDDALEHLACNHQEFVKFLQKWGWRASQVKVICSELEDLYEFDFAEASKSYAEVYAELTTEEKKGI